MPIPPVFVELYLAQTIGQAVEEVRSPLLDGRCVPLRIESIDEPMVLLRLGDVTALAKLLQDENIRRVLDEAWKRWQEGSFVRLSEGERPVSIQEIMADPGFQQALAEGLDDWEAGRVSGG